MKYVLKCRKVDGVLVKSIEWKTRKGVVAHRETLGEVRGQALADAIDRSYDRMVNTTSKKRVRLDKAFNRGREGALDDKE